MISSLPYSWMNLSWVPSTTIIIFIKCANIHMAQGKGLHHRASCTEDRPALQGLTWQQLTTLTPPFPEQTKQASNCSPKTWSSPWWLTCACMTWLMASPACFTSRLLQKGRCCLLATQGRTVGNEKQQNLSQRWDREVPASWWLARAPNNQIRFILYSYSQDVVSGN